MQYLPVSELWLIWYEKGTKVEMLGHVAQHNIQGKPNTDYQHNQHIPNVKHDGGGELNWDRFAATGPGQLAVHQTRTPLLPKSLQVKCEAFCPTAKVGLKLSHAKGTRGNCCNYFYREVKVMH